MGRPGRLVVRVPRSRGIDVTGNAVTPDGDTTIADR